MLFFFVGEETDRQTQTDRERQRKKERERERERERDGKRSAYRQMNDKPLPLKSHILY